MAAAVPGARSVIRPPWWFRLSRAMFFAAACAALSGAGHGVMAGKAPPVWSFGLAFGLTLVGAYVVAGRQRSRPWIVAGVWLGQLGLHAVFAWASPVGGMAASGMSSHAGMAAGGMSFPGPGMVAAHVFAGLVTAWWLHRGETALWAALSTVLGWIRAVAPLRLRPVTGREPGRIGVLFATAEGLRPAVAALRHVLVRRGPPARAPRTGAASPAGCRAAV